MYFCLCSIVKNLLCISIGFGLFWLSLISIIYRNDQCYRIETRKSSSSSSSSSSSILGKNNVSSMLNEIDERIRLNHLSLIGTHNSYHQSNLFYRYEHRLLNEQIEKGIRQIELDIHLMKDFHLIYHLQIFDSKSHCYCLIECFQQIQHWTTIREKFSPIWIFFEIKQMFYEDFSTGLFQQIRCEHFQQIQTELFQIFSSKDFLYSNEVKGEFSSIRLALKQQRQDELNGNYSSKPYGWPSFRSSIGKLIPVFLDDVHQLSNELFYQCTILQNFFFIGQTHLNEPYSSIITLSPSKYRIEHLNEIYSNGQLTRLSLSYGEKSLEQIYSSLPRYSVHILSTDSFPSSTLSTRFEQMLNDDYHSSSVHCHSILSTQFCSKMNFSLF